MARFGVRFDSEAHLERRSLRTGRCDDRPELAIRYNVSHSNLSHRGIICDGGLVIIR
jgi:hypothetical protein